MDIDKPLEDVNTDKRKSNPSRGPRHSRERDAPIPYAVSSTSSPTLELILMVAQASIAQVDRGEVGARLVPRTWWREAKRRWSGRTGRECCWDRSWIYRCVT